MIDISGYSWNSTEETNAHGYLLPALYEILETLDFQGNERRIFDLGCGNGAIALELMNYGYDVTGVDPSKKGISLSQKKTPNLKIYEGSCYDPLSEKYGTYPVVISFEVVEHVYAPRKFVSCIYSLLEKDGTAIISTPYHGYIKNLALAISGKMDAHFTALWDNGNKKLCVFLF